MNRTYVLAIAIATLAVGGCVDRQAQKQAKATESIVTDPVRVVEAQPVALRTLTDTLTITGDLVTGLDVQVGPKVGGRLASVTVKDGDSVTAGQVLATIDNTTQTAALQQAMSVQQQAFAGLQSAQSQLAQATSNAALSPARTTAAVRQAEAALRQARASLNKAQNGARPEERRQAQASADAARTNLENAQKELNRLAKLAAEGAVAANRVDQQQTAVAAAQAQYEQAVQSVAIQQNGTRVEDIAAARAAVQQAEEGVRSARAQKSLDVVLTDQVNAAKAQVESARAAVQSAAAQIKIAQENLSDTVIKAPFAGHVQGKPSQVGTVVGAGTPIVHVIGGSGIYLSGQVPETAISRTKVGDPVTVSIPSLPGRPYTAAIAAISPLGSSVGRLFDVRVQIVGDLSALKPGMFARGEVLLHVVTSASVVPQTAVIAEGNDSFVYIVDGNKAKRVPVKTGLTDDGVVQVTGVPSSAQVIIKGQNGLVDGSQIRVENPKTASLSGTAEARG